MSNSIKKIGPASVFLLGVWLLAFMGGALHAQQRTVSGKVTDASGEGLIGVGVLLKGSQTGTITDNSGNWSLLISSNKAVLEFSSIGYATVEEAVGNRNVINVVLKEDSQALDEVVVVAYGTVRKGDITGALTSLRVDESDIGQLSVNNLLEGKVAGLVVNQSSAMTGAASSVTIRGANSLRGDNQPLYVIDNIPQASTGEFAASAAGSSDFQINQDPLSQLNPADIVDITVLKDASSTAIYGSRGANGVILITTKKGSQGAAKVNVSANYSLTEPTRLLDLLNLEEYASYRNTRQTSLLDQQYHLVGKEVRYVYSGSTSAYDPGDPETYQVLDYKNWQKEIYTQAFSQQYNVSVSGGDKVTYYLSASFKDIDGVVKHTGLMQGDLRANIGAQLSRRTRIELMLNGSIRQNDMMSGGNTTGGATGAVSRTAIDYVPYMMSEDDPNYNNESTTTVYSWLEDYVDKTVNKVFSGSLNFTWNITDKLRYDLRAGGNLTDQDRKRWYGMNLYQGINNNGYLLLSELNRNNFTVENILTWSDTIGSEIRYDVTAGVTYDDYNYLNETTTGSQFTFFELRENGLNMAGTVVYSQPTQKDYQLLSYLARVNFSFFEKYLLTASFRADGSSKFAKGNRWGYFPSASIAWRIEQENFLRDVEWVNQLKLRVSYGVTGNQSIDPYSTFSLYGQDATEVNYADGIGNKTKALIVTNLANSSLKWEQTASWNLGLDFGFFDSRLTGTVDLYSKKTTDLLVARALPGSSGFETAYFNQGGLSNKGLEITVDAHILDGKNWKWSLSGNIGFNKGKIDALGMDASNFGYLGERVGYLGNSIGDHFGVANIFLQGEAPGLFYGYRTQGIVQTGDVTENGIAYTREDGTTGYYSTMEGSNVSAGDIKFVDLNGDGVVDENDKTIIGNPNPDYTFGFSTRLSWKRLTLSASFNGVQGIDRLNTGVRYNGTPKSNGANILKKAYYGMWTAENSSNLYPGSNFQVGNYVMDRYVEDASYLRCSDITLSYSFPTAWMKKIGISYCSLSFSMKNIFLITSYDGYDPEVNSFAFDGLRPGIDMNSYPNPKSFVLAVNLNF